MSFKKEAFVEKINKLTNTQDSIETLAQWMLFHRRSTVDIVNIWYEQFRNKSNAIKPLNNAGDKLLLLFLANDVLQHAKKKGNEYSDAFKQVLPGVINEVS
jgi:regulator of Ty1 transposition protein 103